MPLSFGDRVDLLELYGKVAVDALGQLGPDARTIPVGSSSSGMVLDFRDTVAVWVWSVEHPLRHLSEYESPAEPVDHRALATDLSLRVEHAVSLLRESGPDVAIVYFDRPGTSGEVAHLLARCAVEAAYEAAAAAGRPVPWLSDEAAWDLIDQTLAHLATSRSDVRWRPQPVVIRSATSGAEWYISVPAHSDDADEFRRAAPTAQPGAVVQGAPADLYWWLYGAGPTAAVNGHPTEAPITIDGELADVQALHRAFSLPVPKAARRRWWRSFG